MYGLQADFLHTSHLHFLIKNQYKADVERQYQHTLRQCRGNDYFAKFAAKGGFIYGGKNIRNLYGRSKMRG